MSLNLEPNFHEPGQRYFQSYTPGDDFYEALIAAHNGLSDAQSLQLNSALVLLLANHIGDISLLRQALHEARQVVQRASPPAQAGAQAGAEASP